MRTIILEEDVLDRARALKKKLRIPFKAVINQALRIGLEKVEEPGWRKSYRTRPHPMGLRKGYDLDNIRELLAQAEGEDSR
ncbi:MAG: DUF2191 domain-containing protein [PVC group bacterium]